MNCKRLLVRSDWTEMGRVLPKRMRALELQRVATEGWTAFVCKMKNNVKVCWRSFGWEYLSSSFELTSLLSLQTHPSCILLHMIKVNRVTRYAKTPPRCQSWPLTLIVSNAQYHLVSLNIVLITIEEIVTLLAGYLSTFPIALVASFPLSSKNFIVMRFRVESSQNRLCIYKFELNSLQVSRISEIPR